MIFNMWWCAAHVAGRGRRGLWLLLLAATLACLTGWTAFAMMLPHVRTGDLDAALRLAVIAVVVGVLVLMVVALRARRP